MAAATGAKTIFRTLVTDTATTDVEGVGRIRWEDDKCYRWVCNPTTNFTPAKGNLLCHQFTDGTTAFQNIYKPATATLGFMAGVAVGTISASTGTNPFTYGWIQIHGSNVDLPVTGTVGAGASLIPVNGQVYAAQGQAMGTAPNYKRLATMLDSVTTSTAAAGSNVWISCLA